MPQLLSYQFKDDCNVSKDSMVSCDRQSVSIEDDVMAHPSESIINDSESRINRDNVRSDKKLIPLDNVIKDNGEQVKINDVKVIAHNDPTVSFGKRSVTFSEIIKTDKATGLLSWSPT